MCEVCETCGKPLSGRTSRARFCSSYCRTIARRKKARIAKIDESHQARLQRIRELDADLATEIERILSMCRADMMNEALDAVERAAQRLFEAGKTYAEQIAQKT